MGEFFGLWLSLGLFAAATAILLGGDYYRASTRERNSSCSSSSTIGSSKVGEQERLAAAIKAVKYDLQSLTLPDGLRPLTVEASPVGRHHVSFGNSLADVMSAAVRQGKPSVIVGAATHWPLLRSWDPWSLAQSFPVLTGVLSLSPAQCSKMDGWQVFVIDSQDRQDGHRISLSGLGGARRSASSTLATRDMLVADFLVDARARECGQQRFFSMSYSVLERITASEGQARWRELQLLDPGLDSALLDRLWAELRNASAPAAPAASAAAPAAAAPEAASGSGVETFLNRTDANFWMLPAGAALQCRVSSFHTMRTQLGGEALYTLFAPSHEAALRPFPALHVSAGQSQLDLHRDGLPADGQPGGVFQVALAPGQTLYVPPYWYVHAEATRGLSAVLDVPSPSLPQMMLSEAFYMDLPLGLPGGGGGEGEKEGRGGEGGGEGGGEDGGAATSEERVVAVQVFLVHLLSRALRAAPGDASSSPLLYASPAAFAASVLARYSLLYPPGSLALQQQRASFQCLRDRPGARAQAFRAFVLPRRAQIQAAAQFAADCVNDPSVPDALRRSWLEGYAEHLASFAMRDAALALAFVLECLDQGEMVDVQDEQEVEGPPVVKLAL